MQPLVGKKYTHYKGNVYTVIGIGQLESDPEQYMVIYSDDEYTWLRPIEDFVSDVEVNGEIVPRFKLI